MSACTIVAAAVTMAALSPVLAHGTSRAQGPWLSRLFQAKDTRDERVPAWGSGGFMPIEMQTRSAHGRRRARLRHDAHTVPALP